MCCQDDSLKLLEKDSLICLACCSPQKHGLVISQKCTISKLLMRALPVASGKSSNSFPPTWKSSSNKYSESRGRCCTSRLQNCLMTWLHPPNTAQRMWRIKIAPSADLLPSKFLICHVAPLGIHCFDPRTFEVPFESLCPPLCWRHSPPNAEKWQSCWQTLSQDAGCKTWISLLCTGEPQKNAYFPWNTGCLIGILIMIYYYPHITM